MMDGIGTPATRRGVPIAAASYTQLPLRPVAASVVDNSGLL
jgi:hypothetical protein